MLCAIKCPTSSVVTIGPSIRKMTRRSALVDAIRSPSKIYPMQLIKLPKSGNLIDADAVSFIGITQTNAGHAIKVFVGSRETDINGEDADSFLMSFHSYTKADVSGLQRWIPKREKS